MKLMAHSTWLSTFGKHQKSSSWLQRYSSQSPAFSWIWAWQSLHTWNVWLEQYMCSIVVSGARSVARARTSRDKSWAVLRARINCSPSLGPPGAAGKYKLCQVLLPFDVWYVVIIILWMNSVRQPVPQTVRAANRACTCDESHAKLDGTIHRCY